MRFTFTSPLQLIVSMHSVNAVFLLGETILNNFVSLFPWCLKQMVILHFRLIKIINLQLVFVGSSGSHSSGLAILFCGQLYLWFSSGSSMLVFPFGKNTFDLFWYLSMLNNFAWAPSQRWYCCFHRWPYPFLDLSSSFAPLWYVNIYVVGFYFMPVTIYWFGMMSFCLNERVDHKSTNSTKPIWLFLCSLMLSNFAWFLFNNYLFFNYDN